MGISDLFKKDMGKEYEQVLQKVLVERTRIQEDIQKLNGQMSDLTIQKETALNELNMPLVEEVADKIALINHQIQSKQDLLNYLVPEKSEAVKKAALSAYDEVVNKHADLKKEGAKLEKDIVFKLIELQKLMKSAEKMNADVSVMCIQSIELLKYMDSPEEKREHLQKLFALNSSMDQPGEFNSIPVVTRFNRHDVFGAVDRMLIKIQERGNSK